MSGDRTPFRPTITPDFRFIRPCKTRAVIVALTTQRNALQMLADRVRVIVEYLSALSQDKVRRDDETLRMIASLAGTLPAAVAQTLPVGEASDATLRKEGGGELELEFMTVRRRNHLRTCCPAAVLPCCDC